MPNQRKTEYVLIVLLAVVAILCRLAVHIPNFTPVGALAIFAGFLLRRRWATAVPLAAMLVSDLLIGFYEPMIMAAVYASLALSVLIGRSVKKSTAGGVAAASLAGSSVFFLATNFAVWAFGTWYPRTGAGLTACFINAIPFFRNTVLGDLFFSALFFGAYAAVRQFAKKYERAPGLA